MPKATVLTKEIIKFMKSGEKFIFRHENDQSMIEVENSIGARITVYASEKSENYNRDRTVNSPKSPEKAFAMDKIYKHEKISTLKTIMSDLKPDDIIELNWLAGVRSGLNNEFIQDRLDLTIIRNDIRSRIYTVIDEITCTSNRMIYFS